VNGEGWKSSARYVSLAVCTIVLCAIVSGCGFQLRGSAKLPFETVYIPDNHPMLVELSRALRSGSNVKIVNDPEIANARFVMLGEHRDKVILSVSTAGRVREYQLRYAIIFRVHDGRGGEYIPTNTVVLRRDVTFNEQVLAKETEELLLYQEMRADMVQQIVRRMQAAKLRLPDDD
jgi:LPS-assembly lipoprotein